MLFCFVVLLFDWATRNKERGILFEDSPSFRPAAANAPGAMPKTNETSIEYLLTQFGDILRASGSAS